jgi:hypothetical protein
LLQILFPDENPCFPGLRSGKTEAARKKTRVPCGDAGQVKPVGLMGNRAA